MAVVIEPEVMAGRRAFAMSQRLLAGPGLTPLSSRLTVGWYDTETHGAQGAFALVRSGGEHRDLIGEVLRVEVGPRAVLVYVLGARAITTDLAVARRAFLALGLLSLEFLLANVEVVS